MFLDEQIAISYASPEFLGWMDIQSQVFESCRGGFRNKQVFLKDGFIFNVSDPTKHCARLASTSCVTSIQFNPKDVNQVRKL